MLSAIKPSLDDFIKKTKKFNVIPMTVELLDDFITPIQLYSQLKDKKYSFLLESVEGEEKTSRYSFVGCNPLVILKSKGRKVTLDDRISGIKRSYRCERDPLDELKKLMKDYRIASHENEAFDGGFVGYVGYDNVRFFERVLDVDNKIEDAETCFVLPKHIVVFDHLEKKITLISFLPVLKNEPQTQLKKEYKAEMKLMKDFIGQLSKSITLAPLVMNDKSKIKFKSNFTKKNFEKAVLDAQEHIKAGNIIQVVLSQQFSCDFSARKSFDAYRYLRVLNPSAYMYYLDFGPTKVVGASPEMLLRCEDSVLTTRPIAGTRPRGKNEAEDLELELDLLADKKEIAEHIMLVDLGRNDIGRESEAASVDLVQFKKVERFSHVMHIVSEVQGTLRADRDALDSFRACFPAGTLSGAPKIRAMQIIDELEPESRGIYGGSIGYMSFNGNLDTAIAIRTIVVKNNTAYIQAGAGIVLDSVPEMEYQETINKAKAAMTALEYAI